MSTLAGHLCPALLGRRDLKSREWPLTIRLAFMVENAVELSFIVTYHPMTLLYGMPTTLPFPSQTGLLAQVTGFFIVESVMQRWIPEIVMPQKVKRRRSSAESSDDNIAFRLATRYIIPKATSIVAIGLLGNRFMHGIIGGPVHFCTVVMWVVLRQI